MLWADVVMLLADGVMLLAAVEEGIGSICFFESA